MALYPSVENVVCTSASPSSTEGELVAMIERRVLTPSSSEVNDCIAVGGARVLCTAYSVALRGVMARVRDGVRSRARSHSGTGVDSRRLLVTSVFAPCLVRAVFGGVAQCARCSVRI
jgi:hypothetical protein